MAADTETDASAQLLEEQLQQRVLTSEGAREDGETASNVVRDEPTYTLPGLAENGKVPRIGESGWSANPAVSIQGVLHGGEDQDDAPATLEALPSTCVADASHREIIKDDEDADAEGEEDMFADDAYHDEDPDVEAESPDLAQERISQPKMDSEAMEDVEDGDDGQDIDEGVGAVKIKPGDTDEEDEEEADDSGRSDGGSNAESDGAAAWDQVAGSDEEEEEEEEAEPQNVCLFCNQDEDNDPAPDFETFLTCSGCELNGLFCLVR
jgi:histone acetyltransferase SAS3